MNDFENLLNPEKLWDREMLKICSAWISGKQPSYDEIAFLMGGINYLLRLRRDLYELLKVCDTIVDIRKKTIIDIIEKG